MAELARKTKSNKLGGEICLFWLVRQAPKHTSFCSFLQMEGVRVRCQVTLAATCCSAPPGGGTERVNSTHKHTQRVIFCTVTVYSSRTANCSSGNLLRLSAFPPSHTALFLPFLLLVFFPAWIPSILLPVTSRKFMQPFILIHNHTWRPSPDTSCWI